MQLIDGIRVEPDLATRRRMVGDALRLMHDDLPLIPLYRRTLAWAMRPDRQRRAVAERRARTALGAHQLNRIVTIS